MNKSENKYFNTALKMDKALILLLEKKEFEYITIKEICDTAGVNRSTFYLHYENTSDLLKETTQYILDKHFSYYNVDKKDVVLGLENCERKELIFVTHEYLTPYLTFVKENRRIFKLAIKQFQIMNMDEVYNKLFRYVFEPILERFSIPEKERAYVMKFYLTGVFSVVMEWLENDCKEELDFVIKIISDCVLGMRDISKQ
ncbi:MAG: TetR/AcrR family transcriptional regulator [Ruminococcaceae bacterium]|nr:TetR/AcrR family transcriptional regulator [Oscillospiraceae bacterium]